MERLCPCPGRSGCFAGNHPWLYRGNRAHGYKRGELIREGGLFTTIANGIAAALSAIISGIKMVKQFVSEKLAAVGFETFHALLERVQTRLSQIGSGASDMKSAVTDAFASIGASLANSKFYQMLKAIGKALKTIGGGIVSAFGSAAGSIIDKLSNANFSGIIDRSTAFPSAPSPSALRNS